MSESKPIYFQNLDGFRAIAALLVIFAHLTYWFEYPETEFYETLKFILSAGNGGGRLGVIFFFVLSGFLITYLMFAEQEKTGRLHVGYFYMRRVLRIWPLYFISLIAGFFVYPFFVSLSGGSHHENASLLHYLIFAANFDHIYNYFPTCNILGVQWSVSVEEQFYLLWPLVFYFFNRKSIFPVLLVLIIAFSEWFSATRGAVLKAGDYHLFSCLKYLAFGGLLAYFCYNHTEPVKKVLGRAGKALTLLCYLASLVIIFLHGTISARFPRYEYVYHVIPMLFFGFVIVEQNFSDRSFYKIGRSSLLAWLGKISYGLYLTHMIAINIVAGIFGNGPELVLLKGLLSLL
ncbi:MAG: acyltransferase, partial [Bacteroidota bacterium]